MKKVIRKWFWAWDFDKEEKWLNEMAEKGLALTNIGFCKYTFEESTPGEYAIRLEMLKNAPTDCQSEDYIRFVEETGAEYLGSIMRWVYFRKKKEDGDFELYSDMDSRMKHLSGISTMLGLLGLVNLVNGLNNVNLYLSQGFRANLFASLLCIGVAFLFGYGTLRILGKKRKLKEESQLFE